MTKIQFIDDQAPDLSASTLNTMQTNIETAIDNVGSNSTSEKQIGYWIDGKPLYKKTIEFGALPNATTKRVDHNIANLRDIVSISGIAKDPNGNIYMPIPLSYAGGSVQYNTDVYVNATQIGISATEDRSRYTAYIVLEYTKTTD